MADTVLEMGLDHPDHCTEPDGPGCYCNQVPVVAVSLFDMDSARCADHVAQEQLPLPAEGWYVDEFGVAYGF